MQPGMAKAVVFYRELNEAKVFRRKKRQMQKKKSAQPMHHTNLTLVWVLGSPVMRPYVEERLLILFG